MVVTFYTCTDDPRVLSKVLTQVYTAQNVNIKSELSIMEPILELAYRPEIEACNYLSFDGKYYYVKPGGMIRAPGYRLIVQTQLDVLKTYDTQIRKLPGIATRTAQQDLQEAYLPDQQQRVLAFRTYVTQPIGSFSWSPYFMLLTAG